MGVLWISTGSGAIRAEEVAEVAVAKASRVIGGRIGRDQFAVVLRSFRGSQTSGKTVSRTVWNHTDESAAAVVARRLIEHLIVRADSAGTLQVLGSGEIEFDRVEREAAD
ncbi:hypothetical protein [Nocardia sp. NPDC058114]|uniref:hypothetical protein n=1 Tax=Nocardia sp. NPDC058114 TaxID=3346346 RepID=UPI0036DBA050